jgi:hypothetical protein
MRSHAMPSGRAATGAARGNPDCQHPQPQVRRSGHFLVGNGYSGGLTFSQAVWLIGTADWSQPDTDEVC